MAGFDQVQLYGYDPITDSWVPYQLDHDGHNTAHTIMETKIHDGYAFATGHYEAGVSNNGYITLLVQNAELEMVTAIEWAAEGSALLEVFEDVTFSDAGTALGWTNLNRASTNTLSVDISHTPTITDYGTLIFQKFTTGGSGGGGAGAAGRVPEGIFNITKSYVVRLQNLGGANKSMQLALTAYQHDPYSHTGV